MRTQRREGAKNKNPPVGDPVCASVALVFMVRLTITEFGDFLLFSGYTGLSYVSTTARMEHRRSEKPSTPLICIIYVNQWQIEFLATDFANPIVSVFAGLASYFSND